MNKDTDWIFCSNYILQHCSSKKEEKDRLGDLQWRFSTQKIFSEDSPPKFSVKVLHPKSSVKILHPKWWLRRQAWVAFASLRPNSLDEHCSLNVASVHKQRCWGKSQDNTKMASPLASLRLKLHLQMQTLVAKKMHIVQLQILLVAMYGHHTLA